MAGALAACCANPDGPRSKVHENTTIANDALPMILLPFLAVLNLSCTWLAAVRSLLICKQEGEWLRGEEVPAFAVLSGGFPQLFPYNGMQSGGSIAQDRVGCRFIAAAHIGECSMARFPDAGDSANCRW